MHIRHVTPEDVPYLHERMKQLGSEFIDLNKAPAWVSVDEEGTILGILSTRLVWNIEPVLIFPEVKNKMTRRRAFRGMFKAAESWLSDRTRNTTGIHWYFIKTRSAAVKKWAVRCGLFRQWKGAAVFIKHL